MPSGVTRRRPERWLLRHGFALQAGGKSSHGQSRGRGVTVTLPGDGPADLTERHVGMIVRLLERAGFDRAALLDELKR
jgi:hypothetical protein